MLVRKWRSGLPKGMRRVIVEHLSTDELPQRGHECVCVYGDSRINHGSTLKELAALFRKAARE